MARKLSARRFKKRQAQLLKQAKIIAARTIKVITNTPAPPPSSALGTQDTPFEPEVVLVNKLKVIQMSVAEWAAVTRNPIQRDTRAQRDRAKKYLSNFIPQHAEVIMARLPNGDCYKIDGHTRCHIWVNKSGLSVPDVVNVSIMPCADLEEVKRNFNNVDAKTAVKQASDALHGALRHHDIPTDSLLLQYCEGLTTPLHYAFKFLNAMKKNHDMLKHAANVDAFINASDTTVYDHVAALKLQLIALDKFAAQNLKRRNLKAPLITAIFLAHIKHGDKIINFFERVVHQAGVRHGKKCDAVQKVIDTLEEKIGGGDGMVTHLQQTGKILGALDDYRKGRFEEPTYVPVVNIEQCAACDLFKYLTAINSRHTGAGDNSKRYKTKTKKDCLPE